jgi:hypothetical protein
VGEPVSIRRRMLEYNIEMDLRELELGGVDWIDLTQDRDQ